jgi:6-phosphogluconolactonase (cycloisomerase 2 family)
MLKIKMEVNAMDNAGDRRYLLTGVAGFMAVCFVIGLFAITAPTVYSAEKSIERTKPIFAYVGSRTTKERNARGEGINVYRVDPMTGAWTHVQLLKTPQENASFLTFDRSGNYLYSVHGDFSEVSSYKIDKQTGKLTLLNMESTKGKNPGSLVVDPSNKVLAVANYAAGSLVLLPIRADGSLGPIMDMAQLPGKPGPHKTQQGSSHPHQTLYDPAEKFVLVPDKGLDKIFTFSIDVDKGKLIPGNPPAVTAREGAGTRHITFQTKKPFAYVANELDSSITTYSYSSQNGELKPLQIIPSIPETFTGDNTASEIMIAPSGNFVYVSNRGHDSIGIFSIDRLKGTLTPLGWVSSQGKGPRFFTFDPTGKYLHVANENSDTIVTFKINSKTGKLMATGQVIKTGSPVCIVFTAGE